MIKSIYIQNFQSHKDTELEFDPGMNVIIGKTDSGKTAILRALRWNIWNRPGGDAFRSTWGGKTEVDIITGNNYTVSRIKDKADNQYVLDETIFAAFGTDIPEEIQKALNINEINLQRQFDAPFLLTATSGEVALHFNRIAHIDKIDSSIKKVQQAVRGLEQDITSGQKLILRYTEDLEGYAYLEKMEIELEVLESMERNLSTLSGQFSKLNSLMLSISTNKDSIKDASVVLDMEESVNAILETYMAKETLEQDRNKLRQLLANIDKIETDIDEKNYVIKLETFLATILVLYDQKETAEKQKKELTILINKIELVEADITYEDLARIPKLQAQFEKEMGDECILCGQSISHTH